MKFFKTFYKKTVIDKFKIIEDNIITFKELNNIKLNKIYYLHKNNKEGIQFTRLMSNNSSLIFTVNMKKGELWEKHYHDCHEVILVFKGKLKNLSNNKFIDRAQTLIIDPFTSHYIMAEEDSIFYVEFKNPINGNYTKLD